MYMYIYIYIYIHTIRALILNLKRAPIPSGSLWSIVNVCMFSSMFLPVFRSPRCRSSEAQSLQKKWSEMRLQCQVWAMRMLIQSDVTQSMAADHLQLGSTRTPPSSNSNQSPPGYFFFSIRNPNLKPSCMTFPILGGGLDLIYSK